MPAFEYTALTSTGQRVIGVLTGANEQAVLGELESRALVPVSVAEQRQRIVRVRRGVSQRALGESYQQLGDLLKAGVPLLRGLRLLGARRSRARLAAVFQELADAVADGSELAEAMSKRPEVFPRVHGAMVRAGEKGGFLEAVFVRLGQFVGAQAELRAKVLGSLVYPAILVTVGLALLGAMFGYVIPVFFRPLFDRMWDRLPWITKAVFGIGDLMSGYGLVLVIAACLLGAGAYAALRRPAVRRRASEAWTWMPVTGRLVRALAAARFCRMFGTMLANGIPVLSAMQIAREAAGNALMEDAIERATEAVKSGQPLATPLGESGLFPDDVVEMISVGEAANNLDEVLVTIAETIERRSERLLSGAVRLVEPLILLLIGTTVGLVAVALILPMTQMRANM